MSRLRDTLNEAVASDGYSAQDLTVLAMQHDPFRVDTRARHRDGEWLAARIAELELGEIHLRKLHYKLIGKTDKPNGTPYINTDEDWRWLQEHPAKAARWLGYVPWDQIVDARNAEPVVRILERPGTAPSRLHGCRYRASRGQGHHAAGLVVGVHRRPAFQTRALRREVVS
jgi:hypothetical protein